MKLNLISTPIGNLEDITLRALNALKITEHIVCEELKVTRRRLSAWGIKPQEKKLYQLNEHSTDEDVKELVDLCKNHDVCLVTDCGTPSFFDPGFKLVEACLKNVDIQIESLPGVSSMSALFPFLNTKTERFDVWGFPPRDSSERKSFFQKLSNNTHPVLLLDTPYRLIKTFEDLKQHCPQSQCVAGINLTCEDERIVYGKPDEVLKQISDLKKENFVCMVYPSL